MVIGLGNKQITDEKIHIEDKNNKSTISSSIKKYKKIREHLSKLNSCAPYMIINGKVLSNIAEIKPTSIEQLYNIDGVNNDFICKYGTYFIDKKKKNNTSNNTSSTIDKSWDMYQSGKTIKEISVIRGLKEITIESHIVDKFSQNIKNIDIDRVGINKDIR